MKDNGARYFVEHLAGSEAAPWAASRAQVITPPRQANVGTPLLLAETIDWHGCLCPCVALIVTATSAVLVLQAAFVLAVITDRHPRGQRLAADLGLLPLVRAQLPHAAAAAAGHGPEAPAAGLLAQWLALALGKLVEDAPDVSTSFSNMHTSCSVALPSPNDDHLFEDSMPDGNHVGRGSCEVRGMNTFITA